MAVTVDFEAKNRVKPKRGGAATTGFDRYALNTERKNGQIALAIWVGIILLACLPWSFFEATRPFRFTMPLWCFFVIFGVLFAAPSSRAAKLKKSGKGATISGQNQAPIKTLISKASKIYGISEPDAFIETPPVPVVKPPKTKSKPAPKAAPKPKIEGELPTGLRGVIGNAAQALRERERTEKPEKMIVNLGAASVQTAPDTIFLHKNAFDNLDPSEISALVVSALVHLRQGHARRLFLLDFVSGTTQKTVLFLLWPVLIYDRLLKALWLPHAQQNTDRLSLFLVKNPDLMMSAILKDHAARDIKMQEIGVTSTDVSNWIHQRGRIGSSGEEISTQYKLGRAIHEDPPLEERLQRLQNWAKSSEFASAVEELKAKK
ncbi:hypothetical protein B1R32_10787 [Abditibacterium utsteinense]|uniref:Uncharacterized protein n=1 Tax=Abditibacterium utsteinense TaxID=1960156 RepID=A0A2S8STD2_9BACT|nr:hypothetical protein [Abditibacterium utsteinense]PQV64062.1 hypothetical protein B1R32_10787 [Abditibacterium utsteinense]